MFTGIENRVAIIIGGAGGIGKQTAIRLSEHGAKICIVDVSELAIKKTLDEFFELGIDAIGHACDVTDRKSVDVVTQRCLDKFSTVDILINCAGIFKDVLFKDMNDEQWAETININLSGTYNCIKSVLGIMINNKYGRIVNLSSIAGLLGSPLHAHYSASKAGIIGLSVTLARELAEYNILVNCVAPGIIETSMTNHSRQTRGDMFLSNIPLKRFGTPDEVAKVVTFLVSDYASYMTGQTLNVTGGWLLHS